jgi:pimeloyl-ACP methyl ester carboxylesterase
MCRLKPAGYYRILGFCLVVPFLMGVIWDDAKEQSVADKLSRELEYGQVIWLDMVNGREFPGIFTRAIPEHDASIAIILIHGMGGHPDWPEVISPLRYSLADNGWSTLSIQMPVLPPEMPLADYGKTLYESHNRITSAIQYLENYGYERVVLIGYGFGASVAAHYLASGNNHGIHAFAAISMLARKYLEPPMNLYSYLEKLDLPVLDVYGSEDLQPITSSADERRLTARRNGNSNEYEQVVIWNADHYFTGHDQELVTRIDWWLREIIQGKKEQFPE